MGNSTNFMILYFMPNTSHSSMYYYHLKFSFDSHSWFTIINFSNKNYKTQLQRRFECMWIFVLSFGCLNFHSSREKCFWLLDTGCLNQLELQLWKYMINFLFVQTFSPMWNEVEHLFYTTWNDQRWCALWTWLFHRVTIIFRPTSNDRFSFCPWP